MNKLTRQSYRYVGNLKNSLLGGREAIRKKYVVTAGQLSTIVDRYQITFPGMDVLELGTGWVHWDALVLRNKVKCNVRLYDIWDNRSFDKFLNYCKQIADPKTRKKIGFDVPIDQDLMDRVVRCRDLEACYDLLGFTYAVDSRGTLADLADSSFDLLISNAVFEHLRREDVRTILRRSYEILRPGGWAIHLVVLSDHIRIYAKDAHIKEYLKYSEAEYNAHHQNDIQYINLIQIPEWMALFRETGFEIVETIHQGRGDLSKIEVHPSWKELPEKDLACAVVQFVVRRPRDAPENAALTRCGAKP